MTELDPIYQIITTTLEKGLNLLNKKDFEETVWRLLKRSAKDHDHFVVNNDCFILILSDDRDNLEIILDDECCSDDEYSIDLDSDDDWRSELGDLEDYVSEDDEDYVPDNK